MFSPKPVFRVFLLALLALLPSCATLFNGSKDAVDFSSDPGGAKVYVNGQFMGTTPFQLELISKHSYTIEFRKDGFQNKTVLLTNSVGGGWIVLDVIFGLVPILVDASTGDWYGLDQDHIAAALETAPVQG